MQQQRLDLTGERLDVKINAGERLVFVLSDIAGFPSLDGLTAEAHVFVWVKGALVAKGSAEGVTVDVNTTTDVLTVTLSKTLIDSLPPLCEYRIRLLTGAEPEKVIGGNLFIVTDGGLV